MEMIEWSLQINPNHFYLLRSKGKCLKPKKKLFDLIQEQNHSFEALIVYEKALKIIPNHQWVKDRKDECLKALTNK